jgi:DNA-binding NarL/FixJ family response regulator
MEKIGVLYLTVIAAPDGVMGEALHSLARAIPGLAVMAQTTSLPATHQALARLRPHLLLLDADLPGPDLAACLRRFRTDFPELLIVALTITPTQQATALAAGADHALLPGFSIGTLRQLITEMRST